MCVRLPFGMSKLKEIVRNCKIATRGSVLLLSALMLFGPSLIVSNHAAHADSWTLHHWPRLLDYETEPTVIEVTPLEKAAKPWRLCALYPHLKDSYWLSVNYGMVDQARRLGVSLRIFEAGGYYHADRQADQLEACLREGTDAILLGTVTYAGHSTRLQQIADTTPIIGLVNNLDPAGISAMSGVDWRKMGRSPGRYLSNHHPKGSASVRVAWFPGAGKEGISSTKMMAFQDALKASSADLMHIRYGDTGKMVQLTLVEELLDDTTDIDYIVGTGVTTEAAISALKLRNLDHRIKLLSSYFTHGVYRGVKRGKIVSAPTDQPVLQGRLAIDQAIRVLEGTLEYPHLGPKVLTVTNDNVDDFSSDSSLSPSAFRPTFRVQSEK